VSYQLKEGKTMSDSNTKQWVLGVTSAAIIVSSSFAADAGSPHANTNINLAVASNFYGVPPSNSAITDLINAFEAENPGYTVTVVDNGATATLEQHIIDGNALGVDLFLAADTEHPQDLLINHSNLVAPYNFPPSSPKLYIFNYAQGILAFLSNTPGVDVSCDASGTCGYDPNVYKTVGIADPTLAPYGVAAQTVLTGRYHLAPPLCMSTTPPPTSGNPLVKQLCYPNITAVLNAVLNQDIPVGFVAMSAICSNGIYPAPGTGQHATALAYFAIDSTTTMPPMLVNNYNPLTQAGIAVKSSRGSAQNTELQDFVDFLTDFTTSPSPDSPMVTTLKKFCYSAP
jgi:ABC-type molybdate transport system substrate-binding protein